MEADEPKMSFSPRRESPFSPASPCFPGWAATICLEVVAEEMLPKLASAEVFHWEAQPGKQGLAGEKGDSLLGEKDILGSSASIIA